MKINSEQAKVYIKFAFDLSFLAWAALQQDIPIYELFHEKTPYDPEGLQAHLIIVEDNDGINYIGHCKQDKLKLILKNSPSVEDEIRYFGKGDYFLWDFERDAVQSYSNIAWALEELYGISIGNKNKLKVFDKFLGTPLYVTEFYDEMIKWLEQ